MGGLPLSPVHGNIRPPRDALRPNEVVRGIERSRMVLLNHFELPFSSHDDAPARTGRCLSALESFRVQALHLVLGALGEPQGADDSPERRKA
eukprot:5895928-Alexandrium_andersonii.AAC.1